MLNLSIPALIKIREGLTVNLALSVSQAVERAVPQYKLKEGIAKATKQDDYEPNGTADTVTFWFIEGRSLAYRVGEEITEEDFVRVEGDLAKLQYVAKK